MAPEGCIGHSVRGSVSPSAGPLVVCVWSGRWSREEVRRKPVARLLKDAALMNGAERKMFTIMSKNIIFYYRHKQKEPRSRLSSPDGSVGR